jgi:hypothetical protein
MLNIELLREAVEWVEWQAGLDLEKRQWDQSVWYLNLDAEREHSDGGVYREVADQRPECGTACCFAGYVAEKVHGAEYLQRLYAMRRGDVARVDWLAYRALGLEGEDVGVGDLYNKITDGDNDAAAIRRAAENLAAHFGMSL